MGTGIGRGENRAMEAAQQAIASPLLDNVSIAGSSGVLLNITGGGDLTLGEVTQISEIVHDAAGDDAEIIFGAVSEPAMQGEIRVTVIATGFDKALSQHAGTGSGAGLGAGGSRNVIPINTGRVAARTSGTVTPRQAPAVAASGQEGIRRVVPPAAPAAKPDTELTDMEIPTFIRRQMD